MDQWKYRTILCRFQELKDEKGKKYVDWAITYSDIGQIVGLGKILNHEGSNGWELVSAVAEQTSGNQFKYDVFEYRLFFKKRAQTTE